MSANLFPLPDPESMAYLEVVGHTFAGLDRTDDDENEAVEDLPDGDLPGMWSRSDFLGGDPDTRNYALRDQERADLQPSFERYLMDPLYSAVVKALRRVWVERKIEAPPEYCLALADAIMPLIESGDLP